MTDTPEIQPQDTKIHKIKVSEEYKENALNQIKALVKGNKYDPDDIKVLSFEAEILHFQAETMLNVQTKITEKRISGRSQGPVQVANEIAAKEAMANAYAAVDKSNDMQKQIRDAVLNRNDQGFALNNVIIPLTLGKKEFVIFEPCLTCKTSGKIACQPCSGTGKNVCSRCNGSGMCHCSHCNGAQMVQANDGRKIQCPVCHGRGRITCPLCQQTGSVPCKTCASRGVTVCPNCQGTAWTSRIFIQELQIRTAFDYPKSRLPDKVVAMIDRYGVKIREHADIKISKEEFSSVNLDDIEKQNQLEQADKRKDIRYPIIYEVFLPNGHIEYEMNGKSYYTFLFGTKGRLTHVSPFLDDLIKQGMRKLVDAADGRGDVAENIKKASEYRTLKEGIFFAARYADSKARKMLKNENRMGLSEHAIKDIIVKANKALQNITKKPRYIGLGVACALQAAFIGGYFLSPLRLNLVNKVPNIALHPVLDGAIVASSMLISVLIIQIMAQNALNSVMNKILPDNLTKSTSAKLGKVAYYNVAASILISFAVIEYMRQSGNPSVFWYNNLMSMFF